MTLDELEAEAKKLDPTSRAALISRLSASLAASQGTPSNSASAAPAAPAPLTDEQKEREWLQEALRRSRELRERQIQTEPPDRRPTAPATGIEAPEPKVAPPPVQRAATARPKPKPKATPKKRKAAAAKTTKLSRRPTQRRLARPLAKKRAASRPKPKSKSRPGKPAKPRPSKRKRR